MEIIFKLAGIGLITSIVNQILKHCGKEEIASVTTLAGLIISLQPILNPSIISSSFKLYIHPIINVVNNKITIIYMSFLL